MSRKLYDGQYFKKVIQEIKIRLFRIILSILIITVLSMTLSISIVDFYSVKIPVLFLNPSENISTQIISFMKSTLLPKTIVLIQLAPGQAFFAEIYVSIVTSLSLSIPLILKESINFLFPSLYHNERKIIIRLLFPSLFLFLIGCSFSYYIVVPYTIVFLYKYGESMGITSFFDITQFITFTLNFLLTFGLAFQLPLLMFVLTRLHIVKLVFWKNNFKYFAIILIIFGAFITPDGSGVTMWFVAGPLIFLYILGVVIIKTWSN
ncbi:MAG: twin-arginine translocase subunit TatC [Candidatus Nitrosocosmicus sp.]